MPSISEKGIHKDTERVKLLTKKAPFQLSLFLQATPEERISVSTSQGKLESKCPMINELAWHTSNPENF